MTDEKFEKRLAFAFLDDVKRRWSVTFGQRGASAARFAMNDEFARVLQKQMDFYSNDASADKLSAINKNVDEVKGIMVSNIEKVLDRQEKIELLVDKTDSLNQNAFKFKKSSTQVRETLTPKKKKARSSLSPNHTQLKRQMCLKNAKITAAIVVVVIVVILVIVMSILWRQVRMRQQQQAAIPLLRPQLQLTSALTTAMATAASSSHRREQAACLLARALCCLI
jgi:hypothetical protein